MNLASYASHQHEFPAARWRADFPLLQRSVRGMPLAYLDNAATTQKPQPVIDSEARYYTEINANIHRGVHWLSEQATLAHEAARERVRAFINARETCEIIFTRGTTEAINLVAQSYGRAKLGPGDEVLISGLEHHSNIVPWQMVCQQTGAVLKVAPIDDTGTVRMDEFRRLLGPRTRLVAVSHVSNALGTINPLAEMIALARAQGVPVLVDGAQAVAHTPVDVQAMDCDFYAFSGHKLYAPTGIGVLYGKRTLLDAMPPWQGGGDMIRTVSFEGSTWNDLPYKFEAGTPNIAGAIALGAAIEYLGRVGLQAVAAYEQELLTYGSEALAAVPGLRMIGTAAHKAGILSFVIDGLHAHDIGTVLDTDGIAIRAGHHCAMPVMEFFGVAATARASLAFYNTREDLDRLVQALRKAVEMFA
ncbi:SufS family cysteine desulfurase [Immundisolibacter sp.]|uniref:SufS family cysteine desulfurase n=1 Tax=Immundisolibacter sp. TaxID=1934948 RepID=UPI0035659FAD